MPFGNNVLEAVKPVLTMSDKRYLERLSNCLLSLGDELASNQVGELLILAANRKKTFEIIGEFTNSNDRFKIKKKHFQVVKT